MVAKIRRRKDRDNVWFVDYQDALGRRRRLTAHSQQQAEELLAQKLSDRQEPLVKGEEIPLKAYAERWLATVATELKPSTVRSYRQLLDLHLLPVFGDFKLTDITRARVKQLLAAKRSSGLSKNTVRLIRACLSTVLGEALDDELVKANPTASASRRRGQKPNSTVGERQQVIRPLSDEELARFLDVAKHDRPERRRHEVLYGSENFALFLTLARTGVRPGEAFGLNWEDIDFSKREILIERTLSSSGHVGTTKTGRSRRVDMSLELASALAALYKHREAQALQRGWGEVPQCVFINDRGQPLDESRVRKQFARIMRQARISGHRLYDLRHTFATLLISRGIPITYVAAQLGHAKPTTTLQWYAHWLPRSDKTFVDALDSQSLAPSLAPESESEVSEAEKPLDSLGATRRIRTDDLLITNQLLYQLS